MPGNSKRAGRELKVRVEGQVAFNDERLIIKAARAGLGLAYVVRGHVGGGIVERGSDPRPRGLDSAVRRLSPLLSEPPPAIAGFRFAGRRAPLQRLKQGIQFLRLEWSWWSPSRASEAPAPIAASVLPRLGPKAAVPLSVEALGEFRYAPIPDGQRRCRPSRERTSLRPTPLTVMDGNQIPERRAPTPPGLSAPPAICCSGSRGA